MSEFLRYREVADKARARFASAHPAVLTAFDVSYQAFLQLEGEVGTQRDRDGNSHVGLLPFLFIFHRQAFAAYDALATSQAYLAWMTVRPGIESALIMGKWVEDPQNAVIWRNRFREPKPYIKAYTGPALRSATLPRSDKLQEALKTINDEFAHPNPTYYSRHLRLDEKPDKSVEVHLDFFDDDEDVYVGILGLLHLVIVAQDSLARMFGALFPDSTTIDVGLSSFEERAKDWMRDLASRNPQAASYLRMPGLWPAPD